jgi:hypothetical protein
MKKKKNQKPSTMEMLRPGCHFNVLSGSSGEEVGEVEEVDWLIDYFVWR